MSFFKARGLAAALLSCALLIAFLFADAAFNDALALRPRGAWSPSVSYALDDLVTLRGSTWRSRHNNNLNKLPGSTSPTTAVDWELFSGGFNPLGVWSSSKTYQRNDLVLHLGSTWRSGRTNLNKIPGQAGNGLDWGLLASKGATGATGATGPQGPAGPSAVGNGSQTMPAFRFTSSSNTGIFSPSAGKIALVAGGNLFLHDIGPDLLALGSSALSSNTTGEKNLAIGAAALLSNTEGDNNVAVGLTALGQNTTGTSNTAVGNLAMQGNSSGSENTALGDHALFSNSTGADNTAVGYQALQDNTASNNTAVGAFTLNANTGGSGNTAVGNQALQTNTASFNTAVGHLALSSNSTGNSNTAVGHLALRDNTTSGNTAVGGDALRANTDGTSNTALGSAALLSNTEGDQNTALGSQTLINNTTGTSNTAVGYSALVNTTGSDNTALGSQALFTNTTGTGNVALGANAGIFPTAPSNSIFIGNDGLAGDTTTIKIGTQGTQTSAFIAGIRSVATGQNNAINVMIDSDGQLGTVSSSRRYKEDIQPMGAMSDMLSRMRPVSFRYIKPYADGSKPIEYGLIAEEVAKVFPYLAVFNDAGQPETVKYHLLPTFLLAGYQEQQRIIAAQAEKIAALEERLLRIEAALNGPRITTASDSR